MAGDREERADVVDRHADAGPSAVSTPWLDDGGDVLEAEDELRVAEDLVLAADELGVGREDVGGVALRSSSAV